MEKALLNKSTIDVKNSEPLVRIKLSLNSDFVFIAVPRIRFGINALTSNLAFKLLCAHFKQCVLVFETFVVC